MTTRLFIGAGLLVALALAFFVAPRASSSPDGLEKVAAEKGIDSEVKDHAAADGPLADYAVTGVEDEGLSTGLAGVIGVLATFAVGAGGFALLRRRDGGEQNRDTPADQSASMNATT